MESQQRYIIDRSNIVYEVFDNEVVIINLENGNYYSYNGIGVDIWCKLTNEISIFDIIKLLSKKYQTIQVNELKQIISKSVAELANENLLVLSEINNNHKKIVSTETYDDNKVSQDNIKTPTLQRYTDMQEFLLVDPIHEIDYEKWPENSKDKKS